MIKYEALRIGQLISPWGIEFAKAIGSARKLHKNIYFLHEGEFDLAVPQPIIDATNDALLKGQTRYDEVKGLRTLREKICEKLKLEDGICANPEEILVTNGSSQAIFEIFQCYVSQGDLVLIPTPSWPTYEQNIRLAGGSPVGYPCLHPDLDFDYLRHWAKKGVKIIVINSPHNPTGVVLSRKTMSRLIELAVEFDMLLLSDEAYDGLFSQAVERVTALSAGNEARTRILTTRSFSKCYSMTGFRIGYLHATREIVDRCAMLHAHLSDNVCTFAQFGAIAALDLPKEILADRLSILQKRLQTAHKSFSKFLPCHNPQGGFYLFPSISSLIGGRWSDAQSFAADLLQETGVATVAGNVFGCHDHLRVSVAAIDNDKLEEAVNQVLRFIKIS